MDDVAEDVEVLKNVVKQNLVFKYGAFAIFLILLLDVPSSFQRLPGGAASRTNNEENITSTKNSSMVTTTDTNFQQQIPATKRSIVLPEEVVVPVVGYKHQNSTTKECRLFVAALAKFTQVLQEDPQNHAVRPWTYTSTRDSRSHKINNNNTVEEEQEAREEYYYFPGLSSQLLRGAFADRRMALIGDSTLFYMMRWLQTLLVIKTPMKQDSLQSMTMDGANLEINPLMNKADQVGWSDFSPPFVHKDFVVLDNGLDSSNSTTEINQTSSTHYKQPGEQQQQQLYSYDIVWDGFRGLEDKRGESFGNLWERVRRWQPNILVVNAGLHWLHFQGAGRDAPLAHVRLWTNYETWLTEVVQLATDCGVSLLLLKTTNRICEEKYVGVYADTVETIAQERQRKPSQSTFVDRCVKLLEDLQHEESRTSGPATNNPPKLLSRNDIKRYCQEGTFDEKGVQFLNDRLFHFVGKMAPANATSNLTISIFNDHDVMSCTYTKDTDGRHYHPLNLMRIRLLANMVQALY